jgi:hypothetical protein
MLVYLALVALVHELGHALLARPAGFRLTSLGLGAGAPLLRIPLGQGRVFVLHRWFFLGGACVAIPATLEGGRRAAWFHGGGVLAQLALAPVLRLLPAAWDLGDLEEINALMLIGNLMPWRMGGQVSDGWRLFAALRPGGRGAGVLLDRRAALQHLQRFEAARGSPDGEAWARLLLGWVGAQRGEKTVVEAALTPPLREGAPVVLRALRLALALDAARRGPEPEGAAPALWAEAEALQAEGVDPAARALVCGAAARLAIRVGDREGAARWIVAGGEGHDGGGLLRLAALERALAEGAPTAAAAAACLDSLDGDPLDPAGAVAALTTAGQRGPGAEGWARRLRAAG